MKKIINYFKILKLMSANGPMLNVIEGIFKFVEQTHTEQRPMSTKIALLNMVDGTKIGDFVSLWAGIGEANPIDRCTHLKAQNIEYKKLLTIAHERPFTEEEKKRAEIVLRIFE